MKREQKTTLIGCLDEALKAQKKRYKTSFLNEEKTIGEKFDELTPSSYERFVNSLNHKTFLELMSEISPLRRGWLFDCLDDSALRNFFYYVVINKAPEGANNLVDHFLKYVPEKRLERYLDSTSVNSGMFGSLFQLSSHEVQMYLIEKLEVQKLGDWVDCLSENEFRFFLKFLSAATEDEEDRDIFNKVALLPPVTVAKILEGTDNREVVKPILMNLAKEDLYAACKQIENVYEMLEKSDFWLLDYAEHFSEWNLSCEEWERLYQNMLQREINFRKLPLKAIFSMYSSLPTGAPIKRVILFEILESDEERFELYEKLTLEGKMEMLEIIFSTYCVGTENEQANLEMASFILNNKEELNYFEKLALENYNARLKK